MSSSGSEDLNSAALAYHRLPQPGKLEILATKPLGNQRDLSLAYSPGVAAACVAIAENPRGPQILPSAQSGGRDHQWHGGAWPRRDRPARGEAGDGRQGRPVQEVRRHRRVRHRDRAHDVERWSRPFAALEPTFGGINLEDIKAPECFEVEERLKARMGIPVFHDDQHGTAIIVAAAVLNGLGLAGRRIEDVKIVHLRCGCSGACLPQSAGRAGAKLENIWVSRQRRRCLQGPRREDGSREGAVYAPRPGSGQLADVIWGADIFLGLSAAGVLKPRAARETWRPEPLILALANPTPEIMPDEAGPRGPDAMICTGRSDFPNQVNNVLCFFPSSFAGRSTVGATAINEKMKVAASYAIAELARERRPSVAAAYRAGYAAFGPALIPSPFDPRLILRIAPAVARAAMDTGVAPRPIADFVALHRAAQPLRLPLGAGDEAGLLYGAKAAGEAGVLCRRRRGTGFARSPGGDWKRW